MANSDIRPESSEGCRRQLKTKLLDTFIILLCASMELKTLLLRVALGGVQLGCMRRQTTATYYYDVFIFIYAKIFPICKVI